MLDKTITMRRQKLKNVWVTFVAAMMVAGWSDVAWGFHHASLLQPHQQRLVRLKRVPSHQPLAATKEYDLTSDENLMVFSGLPPSSTITWFQGNHKEASKILKERVSLILEANPWLGGRIQLGFPPKVQLVHESSFPPTLIDEILQECPVADSPVHYEMPLVDQVETLLADNDKDGTPKFLFPSRVDCDGPSWKVTVVPDNKSPDQYFGVVDSMPHIVGDGYTFYAVQNMLFGADPIQALDCERLQSTKAQQEDVMGKQDMGAFVSVGAVIRMVAGTVQSLTAGQDNEDFTLSRRFLVVDNDKVKRLKQEYAARVSNLDDDGSVPKFLSTNDIITSWFLSNNRCSQGMMAVNMRNRLEGHSNLLAGNYESPLWLRCPQDTNEPALIRRSVQSLKRARTTNAPPSDLEMMTSQSYGIITNWSTFCRQKTANLQHAIKQVMQVPIYGPEFFIPGTISHCCIFQYKPNQLGVAVTGTPSQLEGLARAPFASDSDICA